jgi:hypothetical protein
MSRLLALLALVLIVLGLSTSSAQAEKPQLYLSWHAAFGSPRATDTLFMADGDTTRTDTLYLSFDPGHRDTSFLALDATITVRCAEGDTLSPYWRSGSMGQVQIGPRNPRVQFNDTGDWPTPSPWGSVGIGQSAFDWLRTSARVRLVYGIGPQQATGVDSGRVYTVARLLVRHPDARIVNATQPICFEWTVSTFAYSNFEPEESVHYGDHRWVSLNSPGGAICRDYLQRLKEAPQPWTPKKKP